MEAYTDDQTRMHAGIYQMAMAASHPGGDHDGPDLHPHGPAEAIAHLGRRRRDLQAQLGQTVPIFEDAQDRESHHRLASLQRVLREELAQVEHALERAAQGLYGICADCGQPIPHRRLLAMPAASLCVPCQARSEARGGVS